MRKVFAALLLPALLLPLSACGGGMSDDTAMTYIQGILDQNYLGKADAAFQAMVDTDDAEVADALAGGAADALNASYPETFESEEQYARYEVEWVELFMDLTYEKLPGLGYLEPTSTLVQVTWNEETELWELPDDDFWSLDTLIIDYNF